MNSQLFLFLNIAVGLGFLYWFLSGRQGSRSRLGSGKPRPSAPKLEQNSKSLKATKKESKVSSYDAGKQERDRRVQSAKSLNVLFLYNGHDWDAYQVLGVPAGAGLDSITKHYQELIKETADKAKLEFFEAAYSAILKKF